MSRPEQPSRLARRLLSRTLPRDRYDDIAGDLEELFARLRRERGPAAAQLWFWKESLMLSGRFLAERVRERATTPAAASVPHAAATRQDATPRREAAPRRARIGLAAIASPTDFKLGIRMLAKYPGLTVVSTAALAIAFAIIVGFHTATQFMVNPQLPMADGDRIVAIWQHDLISGDRGAQTLGDMLAWQRELESVSAVGAFRLQERAVTVDGATRLVRAAQITPSLFDLLRTPPALGRPLGAADAVPGGPAVAMLGFDFWQTALDGDESIIGQTIEIGGAAHTVVGVMPEAFAFPQREDLWTPLPIAGASIAPGEGPAIDFAVARLADDASLETLDAELQVAGGRHAAAYPESHSRLRPRVSEYALSFLESGEPGLVLMMQAARLAVAIVLLVVAVNVGTLVYARNAARLGEIAVRMALGASRFRIVMQMFVEALVLSSLAAAIGISFLLWPLSLFRNVFYSGIAQGDGLPYWFNVGFGPGTVPLVAVLILLAAVLTGVLPALKLTDGQLQTRLQRVQDGSTQLRFGRTATVVVIAQVALSVALLTVGGAQLQTFNKDWWSRGDGGIDREHLLTAQLRWDRTDGDVAADDAIARVTRADAQREFRRRAAELPDVQGASLQSYGGIRFFMPDAVTARNFAPVSPWTYASAVDASFFAVQGMEMRAGRALGEGDFLSNAAPVAIVNEAFVRATMPVGDAVGQTMRQFDPRTRQLSGESLRIVGVVSDTPSLEISHRGPEWIARPAVYLPLDDASAAAGARALIRTRGEPERLVGRLQGLATEVDPMLVVHQPQALAEADRIGLTFVALYGLAVGLFVFSAILLSTTGVYALMSFTATQRTREIGIRTALGAPASSVVWAIFSRAMTQLGIGTVLGLGLGYLGADGPFALSAGLIAEGPAAVIGVAALILLMGLLACARPMRRALRVQPTEALRADG